MAVGAHGRLSSAAQQINQLSEGLQTTSAGSTPRSLVAVRDPTKFAEDGGLALLTPNDLASPPRVLSERFISFMEMSVDCALAFIDGRVVAVVNDCTRHAAEDRLDDVEELRAAR